MLIGVSGFPVMAQLFAGVLPGLQPGQALAELRRHA